jgi:CheY-like chemotaxis protein
MDLQLPVEDGLSATRRWREQEAALGRRRLPIIAATAFATHSDRGSYAAAGMDGYISKPFGMAQLLAVLAPPHEGGAAGR